MANQTIIEIDLSDAIATNVTVADLYATKVNAVLTGNVNATGASQVTLPANTAIGNVTSTEIGYIDGVTSSIQSQINTLTAQVTGSLTGNLILPAYVRDGVSGPITSGSIVFEGSTSDTHQLFLIPTNPTEDVYLTLPAITDTIVTRTSTDTFTNKTFDTLGTGNNFRVNNNAINAVTGSGSTVVLSGSPSLTGTTNVAALNTTGNVIVGGDLTVNGTTTTINANNLIVDDKNIELGSVVAATISASGTIGTVSGAGPFTATITNMVSTSGLIPGQTITATAGTGNFGSGVVTVVSIVSATSITISSTLTFTAGTVTNILGQAANDTTAAGGGITLKGTTDKTFNWTSGAAGWTSSENISLGAGKDLIFTGSTSGTVSLDMSTATAGTQVITVPATTGTMYVSGGTDVSLADGGTNASLTASLGGIVYSTGTAMAILAGVASAGQILRSGASAAPTWTPYTLPATVTANSALYASATNTISAGTLPVAAGGTNATAAGIAAFNNITGYTAAGATGTTSTNIVFSTSPSLTTPAVTTSLTTPSTSFDLLNTTATTLNIGGAATTLTIGGTTATSTLNLFTGATVNGATKTINIGTTSVSGSTTNVNIGSAVSGSGGTITFNENTIETGLKATGAVAPTIASATTIAPTTQIVFISGTTAIATITAPAPISTTGGQITLIPTGIFTTTTAGNIALASTAVVSRALIMTYDATALKWYPSY